MKKILLLLTITFLTFSAGVSAQHHAIEKLPTVKMIDLDNQVRKPVQTRDEVQLYISYYLYDFLFDTANYIDNTGWRMNSHFTTADTAGGDLGIIKYFVVAFDTFFDYDNFQPYDDADINTIKLDSIFIRCGWEQNSVIDDSMKITVVRLNASGLPSGVKLWDTILVHSLGSTIDNQWNFLTTVAVGPNLVTTDKKFGVKVEYLASKEDTFAFVAGFPKNSSDCSSITPNPPKVNELYPKNAFAYFLRFSALMDDDDIFYDCNHNGSYEEGIDGASPIQDINMGVIVTLDLGSGIRRINPDLKNAYVYPNPASSSTTLFYTLFNQVNTGVVSIYDITGKEVVNMNLSNLTPGGHNININTSGYASGIYMYSISTDNGKTYGKFMKK